MKESAASMPSSFLFSRLPTEMKVEIFKHLSVNSKKDARLVCREWSDLISHGFEYSFRVTDANIQVVLNTKQEIEAIETGELQQPLPISSTRGGGALDTTDWLIINSKVSPENIRKLLHSCSNISILELNYLAKNALQPALLMRDSFPMQNLGDLKLIFVKFEPFQAKILKKLAESSPKFQSLGCFEIRWEFSFLAQGKLLDFYEAYLSVHRLVWKHAATLTTVETDFSEINCCGWNHKTIVLTPDMERRYNEVMETPAKSTLFMLNIGFAAHEGLYPWSLSTTLFKAQTKLWKLSIDLETVLVPSLFISSISSAYSQCSKTLRITSILFPDNLDFNCDWLQDCGELISLFLETFRPLRNVKSLPKNILRLTLEGRPSLAPSSRQWIAENCLNASSLRLNLLSHPMLWNGETSEVVFLLDVQRLLRMGKVTTLSLTAYSFYDYSRVMTLAKELGFAFKVYNNHVAQQITMEFFRGDFNPFSHFNMV